eukprot:253038-Chlamydomonas_euryale.AAC.1
MAMSTEEEQARMMRLHRMMGHVGVRGLQRMIQYEAADVLPPYLVMPPGALDCDPCIRGKFKRLPFKHPYALRALTSGLAPVKSHRDGATATVLARP